MGGSSPWGVPRHSLNIALTATDGVEVLQSRGNNVLIKFILVGKTAAGFDNTVILCSESRDPHDRILMSHSLSPPKYQVHIN